LEKNFCEQFFSRETQVRLIDVMNVKSFNNENMDDYLNTFQRMKYRYVTEIPEHELVRMTTSG